MSRDVERDWGVTAAVCDAFAGVSERRVKSVGVAGIHSGVNSDMGTLTSNWKVASSFGPLR